MIEIVKVKKNNVTKEIQKKDLPQYISMGWKKVGTNASILDTPLFKKI